MLVPTDLTMKKIAVFVDVQNIYYTTRVTVKLLLTVVLILYTSPAATHALAKAARHGGIKPVAKIRETPSS